MPLVLEVKRASSKTLPVVTSEGKQVNQGFLPVARQWKVTSSSRSGCSWTRWGSLWRVQQSYSWPTHSVVFWACLFVYAMVLWVCCVRVSMRSATWCTCNEIRTLGAGYDCSSSSTQKVSDREWQRQYLFFVYCCARDWTHNDLESVWGNYPKAQFCAKIKCCAYDTISNIGTTPKQVPLRPCGNVCVPLQGILEPQTYFYGPCV